MTEVDIARLQGLLDAAEEAEAAAGLMIPTEEWNEATFAAYHALPALLGVVAERDALKAKIQRAAEVWQEWEGQSADTDRLLDDLAIALEDES